MAQPVIPLDLRETQHGAVTFNVMPDRLWIFCTEIGAVKAGRFGWFGAAPDDRPVGRPRADKGLGMRLRLMPPPA